MKSGVSKTIRKALTIRLEPREDGGLRVRSDDLCGLILSGPDPAKIMADVLPAIIMLQSWRIEEPLPPTSSPPAP